MAVWQFLVGLIPRVWAERDGNGPEMLYDEEGCNDSSIIWEKNRPAANLVDLISQVLPPTESWDDSLRIWGDLRRSDIQVSVEGKNVESVMVRIDTRGDTSEMCSKIVDLARGLDCCLFLPAARLIIEPEVALLRAALCDSRAAHFSEKPTEFIERLSRTPRIVC
jgi:hypothetical protein